MTRITLLFSSMVLALAPARAERKPNILFILTEDQGPQMECLGTAGLKTPMMDALADSGVLFTNGFVNYPVCSASKATIYTGCYSHTNGLLNNTLNYHQKADSLTPEQTGNPLYRKNRVRESLPTLIELLREAGYHQGVSHKLHVAPNEKFPYDEFIKGHGSGSLADFIKRARKKDGPWFFMDNIPNTHRPYPNSDKRAIRVNPAEIELPAFLPDTPLVRQDWAEYLAGIEEADALIGETLAALRKSGDYDKTIIVFLGDHGPTFQHGKMTLHDLGLRVPFFIRFPGGPQAVKSPAPATAVDLMPTLLDLIDMPIPETVQGVSLAPILRGDSAARPREFAFAEISNRGPLPNKGMQERSVTDGRWKLIYREKTATNWRQVNADTKDAKPWGNRTYAETIRVKDRHPELYRILAEMDPQSLGGTTPVLEFYDLKSDPDEMKNLAGDAAHRTELDRMWAALRHWVISTADPAVKPPAKPPVVK